MNKTKKIILSLISVAIIIILLLLLFPTDTNTLKNDYYSYINKTTINQKIEEDEVGKSTFTIAQDKVDEEVSNIITKITTTPSNAKENQISNFYKLISDTNKRNTTNISPLIPYIELIENTTNIEDFINIAITIEKELNIDILTRTSIAKDFKDNTKLIIYFYPINFDYGLTSDYYTNTDYLYYHALIKQYNIKLLKQYGYTKEKAKESATLVDNFYKEIAKNSKTSKELNNVEEYYNIVTKEQLQEIYTNLNIQKYLSNINNEISLSIVDINNYKTLNNYLNNDNLKTLKEYVKLKILQKYAIYTSEEYSNLIYELNDKLQGTKTNSTQEEKNINIINTYFSYDIDKIYTENKLKQEHINYIKEMTNDILSYYKEEINENNWLSEQTKNKALLKLDNIKINIGLNNNYPTYSDNYTLNMNKSLLENIITMNKTISDYMLQVLNDNYNISTISQTTVNAYYNPQENSINFPTATILLFNIKDNYYKNLGSIGMILAHEITHAFDSNGAKFDEYGNINNWWTKEDYQKFNNLRNKVIKYYSQYEVLDGLHIDGELTADENIADLGSISCISAIAKEKKATIEEIQQMYESFALMWASNYKEDYQKTLLLQDNHSPNKYRVNGTLSSTDLFYKVYNITMFDKMYINKESRVKIW